MSIGRKIVIEVMYKADYCLPCFYMDQTVLEVLPKYAEVIEYRRVDFLRGEGKKRFLELSCLLYGEENFKKNCLLAPVPSLFIDGELVFDAIPPLFELEDAIREAIAKGSVDSHEVGASMSSEKIHLEVLHEGAH